MNFLVFLLFAYIGPLFAKSDYIITTLRIWQTSNSHGVNEKQGEVCVSLFGNRHFGTEDNWHLQIINSVNQANILSRTDLFLSIGSKMTCSDVTVPELSEGDITLRLGGNFIGTEFTEEIAVKVVKSNHTLIQPTVFIHTDKNTYKRGDRINFRVFKVIGTDIVSTDPFKEISVTYEYYRIIPETPIWKNVKNDGIINLKFDVPKKIKYYTPSIIIRVIESNGDIFTKSLPLKMDSQTPHETKSRFDVAVKPHNGVLGNDTQFTFEICVKYASGNPASVNEMLVNLSYKDGYHSTKLLSSRQIKTLTIGCRNITFDPIQNSELNKKSYYYGYAVNHIIVDGHVSEKVTNETLKFKEKFKIHRNIIFFNITTVQTAYTKKLPTLFLVKATFFNNKTASNEQLQACIKHENDKICKVFTTDDNGLLNLAISGTDLGRITITPVNYKKTKGLEESSAKTPIISPFTFRKIKEDTVLSIYQNTDIVCDPGKSVNTGLPVIYYTKHKDPLEVMVQVISKGRTVKQISEKFHPENTDWPFNTWNFLYELEPPPEGFVRGAKNISVSLPVSVFPRITFIVWLKTPKGALIADESTVNIDPCMGQDVRFSWEEKEVEIGKTVVFNIKTDEESTCSIAVVSKRHEGSLSLQKNFNNMRQELHRYQMEPFSVTSCLKHFKNSEAANTIIKAIEKDDINVDWIEKVRRNENFQDLDNIFRYAGYEVVSNLASEKKACEFLLIAALKQLNTTEVNTDSDTSESSKHKISKRDINEEQNNQEVLSSETLIWEIVKTDKYGNYKRTVEIPNYPQEWIGNAVCFTNAMKKVGFSNETLIRPSWTIFSEIVVNSTAIRGEEFNITIVTYNNADTPMSVSIKLNVSPEFELSGSNDGEIIACIEERGVHAYQIKIIPKIIFVMNINGEVTTNDDASCSTNVPRKSYHLTKKVSVIPEGKTLRRTNYLKHICMKGDNETGTWKIKFPQKYVGQSGKAMLEVSEDRFYLEIGNYTENFVKVFKKHFLKSKYGCCQKMKEIINTFYGVYVMEFLRKINQLTEKSKKILTDVISENYQIVHSFVRTDGSFSLNGNEDVSGSTWLTAFMIKNLYLMKEYIDIDESLITNGVQFLKNNILSQTGCFSSTGNIRNLTSGLVFDYDDIGNNISPLNAFIVSSLAEAGYTSKDLIEKPIKCIINENGTHPLSLALRSYALAVVGAPEAKKVIDQLISRSVQFEDRIYWPQTYHSDRFRIAESIGYSALALIKENQEQNEIIVKKIFRHVIHLGRRQAKARFMEIDQINLQNILVFMESISEMINIYKTRNTDLSATISTPLLDKHLKIISLSYKSEFIHQFLKNSKIVEIPTINYPVSFHLRGQGCVKLQGIIEYNVIENLNPFPTKVSIEPNPSQESNCTYDINICISYSLQDQPTDADVFVILPLGYDLSDEFFNSICMKYTLPFMRGNVLLHWDNVTSTETCYSFPIELHNENFDGVNPEEGFVYVDYRRLIDEDDLDLYEYIHNKPLQKSRKVEFSIPKCV